MTATRQTLLLIHFTRDARETLAAQLDLDGYSVHQVATAASAIEVLKRTSPAAVVLGALERPAAAAYLLRELRAGRVDGADRDVVVLTFGGMDAVTQLRAYEAGSDHHLAGDVAYVVLRAIVVAVLRHTGAPRAQRRILEFDGLTLDLVAREVRVGDQPVDLTAREYDLLTKLASDPERVFTKQELLSIWGYQETGTTRTLDSHACRLRKKLSTGDNRFVVNVWGVGYRLRS